MDIGVPCAGGVFQKLVQFTTPMRPIGKTQFVSSGRLDDSFPQALTSGVVDLVAAATSYVQPADGKKLRKIVKPYKALYNMIMYRMHSLLHYYLYKEVDYYTS